MAKAANWNEPDGEGRKLGARTGLDTRVVLAVNDADLVCTVARLKLKGIGGGAPQRVEPAV